MARYEVNGQPVTKAEYDASVARMRTTSIIPMTSPPPAGNGTSDILGEPTTFGTGADSGYVGSNTGANQQAFVGFRNPRRQVKEHGGSGAGSAAFAAQDPRRLDLANGPVRDLADVAPGAEPTEPEPATEVTTQQINNNASTVDVGNDLRVRIRVPSNYITDLTKGSDYNELSTDNGFGGVIFPYTPQITLEHKADYTTQQPLHSNYAINFYKSSAVADISITGKFTVQNDYEAMVYLSTVRLLSALTKMRFGGKAGDPDSGAPPPVCRLDAYGEYMLKNVPVVITSFKHDLPNDVDFYTIKTGTPVSVPVSSTITVNCKPTYSRDEMRKVSVSGYLDSAKFRGAGYL